MKTSYNEFRSLNSQNSTIKRMVVREYPLTLTKNKSALSYVKTIFKVKFATIKAQSYNLSIVSDTENVFRPTN